MLEGETGVEMAIICIISRAIFVSTNFGGGKGEKVQE